jgi:hypothetical protein
MNTFAEPRRRALRSIDCQIESPPQVFFIPDGLYMAEQDDFVQLNAPILGGLARERTPEFSRSHFGITDFNVGAIGRRSWAGAIFQCLSYDTAAHCLLL